jgi:hypothetical protein
MSTRTLTDYLASLPTATSNGSEQVPAVKGGDLVNLPSQGRTVVSTLPETLTAGQELFVESGGVISHYIGNVSNVPVLVNKPAYRVVTELPETLAVGDVVLFNGTTWRGLLAGESSLPTGTPWPVRGWKESRYRISATTSTTITLITIKDDGIFTLEGVYTLTGKAFIGGEFTINPFEYDIIVAGQITNDDGVAKFISVGLFETDIGSEEYSMYINLYTNDAPTNIEEETDASLFPDVDSASSVRLIVRQYPPLP